MSDQVIAVIGLLAAIGALVFTGIQSRHAAAQTKLANEIAAADGMRSALHLQGVLAAFIERPGLRKYFYDGADVAKDGPDASEVGTVGEMLADCLDCNIQTARLLRLFGENNGDDWRDYSRSVIESSPALRKIVTARGSSWWPDLHSIVQDLLERPESLLAPASPTLNQGS
jgi:hypothetical protein